MARRLLAAVATALTMAACVAAQTPACEALEGADRQRAQQLMSELFLYDCCDRTIAARLADTPTCRLAARLADSVCRRVAAGQDAATISRGLARRARSMTDARAWEIDLDRRVAAAAALLAESKKEGLRNQVDATPALFVNGRRYVGDTDLDELVDVLLEEDERVAPARPR
ncbi:MAG: hypothetical protein AB1505_03325 [Candidatus Latescibacterota bacterium]